MLIDTLYANHFKSLYYGLKWCGEQHWTHSSWADMVNTDGSPERDTCDILPYMATVFTEESIWQRYFAGNPQTD